MAVPTQKITTMIAPIVMTATCTDDEIACLGHPQVNGTDVQVLTIVLSNAKLDDGIDLKVYYLGDSGMEVASLESIGLVTTHLQYLLMQVAEHEVKNANCDCGVGYRIVFSFHCLDPFQPNWAMVSNIFLFSVPYSYLDVIYPCLLKQCPFLGFYFRLLKGYRRMVFAWMLETGSPKNNTTSTQMEIHYKP